jgi:hypothetical protein
MPKLTLDRKALLSGVESSEYKPRNKDEFSSLKSASLAECVLLAAQISSTSIYHLSRKVAAHLLEVVPEPEEVEDMPNEDDDGGLRRR